MIYHSAKLDGETGLFLRQQRIYIAGKPEVRSEQIRQMYDDFEEMGHHITYRWADEHVEVKKPYRENADANKSVAFKIVLEAALSDVFILMQDKGLHGALVEKGVFINHNNGIDGKKLYIVEDDVECQSIFDTLDFVEVVKDTNKIYRDLGRIANLIDKNEVT